jgi:predicted MFS family arabinose efflux permease
VTSKTLDPHGATAHGLGTPLSRRREAQASVTIGAIAFLIVTGETVPVGLIGAVARGVGATQSQLGLVVSWYALVAALSAVPLTRWSSRFDRRHVLLGCATLFGVAQVIAAVATNLPVLVLGRGLGAMCHGLYFAVAAPTVIRIARPEAKVRAGGRVAVGGSSALVLGTPLATLLGQVTSWRIAMLAVAGLSLVLAAAVTRVLPRLPAVREAARSGGVGPTLRSPGLGVVLSVTFVIVTAHFALFTYVAPFAAEGLGIDGRAFTVVLLLYGAAAVLGSTLAGRLAELGPIAGVRAAAAAFVAALTGVWLAARLDAVAAGLPLLVLWGGTFAVLVVSTGLAVMRRARGPRAETANALYGIVFQLGIVAGSALGSFCYAADRLSAVPLVAAAGGLMTLTLLLFLGRAFRRGEVG